MVLCDSNFGLLELRTLAGTRVCEPHRAKTGSGQLTTWNEETVGPVVQRADNSTCGVSNSGGTPGLELVGGSAGQGQLHVFT